MVTKDQPHSGRPSTTRTEDNIGKIRNLISEDQHKAINQLEDYPGCPAGQFSLF